MKISKLPKNSFCRITDLTGNQSMYMKLDFEKNYHLRKKARERAWWFAKTNSKSKLLYMSRIVGSVLLD